MNAKSVNSQNGKVHPKAEHDVEHKQHLTQQPLSLLPMSRGAYERVDRYKYPVEKSKDTTSAMRGLRVKSFDRSWLQMDEHRL